MLVKEVFSELYNESVTTKNPTWELECNCEDKTTIQLVETLFQSELMDLFQTRKASEKVIPVIHRHFDQIIKRKNNSKSYKHKEIFSYLQLTWGISATTQLNWDGEFVYCYEIFMKSVFDKVFKNGETYDLKEVSVYKYLESKNKYLSQSKDIIEQWFSQLYYYSKSFSGLNEWCEYFFEEVYYYLNEDFQIESYHPQLLSNLLSWCEVNFNSKGSRVIRNIIEREYQQIRWSDTVEKVTMKSSLGLQLLLCQNYKNNEKKKLFTELDSNFNFHPLSRMQGLIALCIDEENLNNNYDFLIDSIKTYNTFLNKQNLNTFDYIYQRARVFKNLLNATISIAIEIGKGELIDDLLITYYDIKNPQIKGSNAYIVPNQKNNVAYCLAKQTIFDEKESQKLLIQIVDIENKAFNTFRLLKGGIKQKITPTNQPIGLPVPKLAKEYETKLFELYDFSKLNNELQHLNSLSQFDFNSFPLQALMIRSIEKTLPINLSLSEKLEFSRVQKILFWSGFSQTSEIEMEALKEIFDSKKVTFEIHNEENSDLIRFQSRIDELDPEIIWISSHGEYKHYEPNVSEIKLSEKESIAIRDFELLVNNSDKRRLLFLNICEGGVHSQTGEFKNLGFPNLLTSDNQDVISHLWMAEPRFAYVFGVFFALGITHLQKNFFDAFQYSLLKVLSNKTSILDELEKLPLELINLKERITNNDGTEWGNIITTGSPVYNI
ncbi:hypothetical protein P700755_001373 [Psychroflexus torquis ATCC 700755]|uniref:CHAT domain-containing protein n=1 Tax=Psychroflexus torquis (strain ATCC 700755 / CIP 106069 / ACAM 623) TaxID=313595 RepID=K4IEL7_PSYTT|nr:hypothetical protein [Psychroflexus torquis]AFU68303.1 hypothetical protein P700755_001373 [Psychroflexus torquis ATCC 700755]